MSLRDYLFYEEPGITLYCGDALVIVPLLEKAALVLSDPPYGIGYTSTHNSHRKGAWANWARSVNFNGIRGDDKPFEAVSLLPAGERVALFGGNYFASRLLDSRCWIVWDKRDGIGVNNFADCELIWTNFDKPSRIYRHVWSGLIRAGEENVSRSPKLHPHQKPVALMRWLIQYSDTSGMVLDAYAGSGPVLQAAKELGRRAVGIEIEPKYCEIAVKRLRQEVLF